MALKTASYSFLDKGAVYLTKEQMDSPFLSVRYGQDSSSGYESLSREWNPERSVYARVTGCYQEAIQWEKLVRYDYEQVFYELDDFAYLGVILCAYFKETVTLINPTVGGLLDYVFGIGPVLGRQVDSIRAVSNRPGQFTIELVWDDRTQFNSPCRPTVIQTPVAPIEAVPAAPPPHSLTTSPAATPANTANAILPLTVIPPGRFANDFGARNNQGLFWAYRYQILVPPCSAPRTVLAYGMPRTPASQPNPYSVGPGSKPSSENTCQPTRNPGFYRNGIKLGDMLDHTMPDGTFVTVGPSETV